MEAVNPIGSVSMQSAPANACLVLFNSNSGLLCSAVENLSCMYVPQI